MAYIGNRTTFKSGQALDLARADTGLAARWAEAMRALGQSGLGPEQSRKGYAAGGYVDTPAGPVAVETLRVGDLVMTADSGPQPVRHLWQSAASGEDLVRIAAGALGNASPVTLRAADQVVIASPMNELLFGEAEVLARVGDLIDHPGFRPLAGGETATCHAIGLDRAELVRVNGLWCQADPVAGCGMASRPLLKPHEVAVLCAPLEGAGFSQTAIALLAA